MGGWRSGRTLPKLENSVPLRLVPVSLWLRAAGCVKKNRFWRKNLDGASEKEIRGQLRRRLFEPHPGNRGPVDFPSPASGDNLQSEADPTRELGQQRASCGSRTKQEATLAQN